MSSARWRSDRPPTVFDWLMRHWFRNRAALTRPNFGTAISMSKTFAVETNSGGLLRICSICTRPSFKSFFSCARRTRMSLALLRASMRWSRERAGACAWVFATIGARILTVLGARSSLLDFRDLQGFFDHRNLVCNPTGFVWTREPESGHLGGELGADSSGGFRVPEENGPERNRGRPAGDQLERVAARRDAAYADDRQRGGPVAGEDRRQRDRLQCGSRVTPSAGAEDGSQRARIQPEAAHRVHEREPVRTRRLHRLRGLGDIPARRRELGEDRECGLGAAGRHDLGCRLGSLVD